VTTPSELKKSIIKNADSIKYLNNDIKKSKVALNNILYIFYANMHTHIHQQVQVHSAKIKLFFLIHNTKQKPF
jgi:hypothetical protein